MWQARWKLVSLWFSQTARVTADNALRFFVCLDHVNKGTAQQNSAWYLVTAIFTLPAVLLAPFNGAICNTLPKRQVLVGSTLFGFVVMFAWGLVGDYWLWCWGLIAIGSAIFGPTRYAMLPAAAQDSHWPLTRINGFIEMGTFSAILGGMIAVLLTTPDQSSAGYNDARYWQIAGIIALNGLALLTAWPTFFPSDVRRDEPPFAAVRDFFSDFRDIWNIREARYCLIGLSGKRGLVIGMSGAMLAIIFNAGSEVADAETGQGVYRLKEIAIITGWVMAGVATGSLLAGLQKHPRRVLGLVPIGGVGFSIGMAYAAATFEHIQKDDQAPIYWFCALVGMAAGLINVPLASTYQAQVPDDARGNAMAVRNMTDYVCATIAGIGLTGLTWAGMSPVAELWLVAVISALATLAAWWIFRREIWELIIEFVFAIMYRFRAAGPGLEAFPLKGPVIVVANHSSWMDPMWLAKALPRTMIPMMTSVFFDHWLLRWTMIYLADAIRVEHSGFRRDIPELQKAIAALDAGKCLVIFPEGRLRRTEEQPLKMFGQGIWHILKERPDTPVVVCWIEGGWGCYFSYFKGPPTKNKRIDIVHPLGIAVGEPHKLDAQTLSDHRQTRKYLMEQCAQARRYLGLEPIALQQADVEEPETQG